MLLEVQQEVLWRGGGGVERVQLWVHCRSVLYSSCAGKFETKNNSFYTNRFEPLQISTRHSSLPAQVTRPLSLTRLIHIDTHMHTNAHTHTHTHTHTNTHAHTHTHTRTHTCTHTHTHTCTHTHTHTCARTHSIILFTDLI